MEAMAEACGGDQQTQTVTQQHQADSPGDHGLTLRLTRPRGDRRVVWTSDTIDNEHLGRRSSKCCCVYQKPLDFGESSSDSETEEGGCGNAHCPHSHAHSHRDTAPSPPPPAQPTNDPPGHQAPPSGGSGPDGAGPCGAGPGNDDAAGGAGHTHGQ